jgi:polyisoprenoid-binding protein YceI
MKRWTIDPVHSEVNFKVKHLMVSTVSGHFDKFDASIESDKPDFSDAKVFFEADVESINTKIVQRDVHLKSPDFFNSAVNPKITFVSTGVKKLSESEMEITGDFTINGITKAITLNAQYNGTVVGFGGATVAGFELRGAINRFDFGLHWNAMTEAGGVIVSDIVKLEILAEMIQAKEVSKAA